MRLWHKDLITILPRQQLIGQWRECCSIAQRLAKNGTPNHILVNKILDYGPEEFVKYCNDIMIEMKNRGYRISEKSFQKFGDNIFQWCGITNMFFAPIHIFSKWHNDKYLKICLYNLYEKYLCGGISNKEWQKISETYPISKI